MIVNKIFSAFNSSLKQDNPYDRKWLFITLYLLIFLVLLITAIVNLITTKDAFDPNSLDYLNPTEICKRNNELLNQCLSKYKEKLLSIKDASQIDDCISFSLNVQNCYDDVMNFNKKCSIYLTMLFKCMNNVDNKNDTNFIKIKCRDSYENLKRCNTFDDLLIQADKIFGDFEDNNAKNINKISKKDNLNGNN